jgi:methyl-accepting chemotaxis protein
VSDPAQAVPLSMDPAFKAALIALIGSLTTLAAGITGWFMRERKTKREAESAPGYALRRESDKKLAKLEGEVGDLARGLKQLSDKAEDLASAAERAADRMDQLEEKVDEAAKSNQRVEVTVTKVTTDMEWVKDTLKAIKQALGI